MCMCMCVCLFLLLLSAHTRVCYHCINKSTLHYTTLRRQMKMKVFELERVTTTQDETSAAFRKLRLESDMLMKKNKVLQTEYYSLQNETDRRLADAASQKQLAESRLQTYEALESELDGAVLNATSADSKSDAAMMAQLMQSIGQVGSVCVCVCMCVYIYIYSCASVCLCMHACLV
jgi:hypothetical protein